MNVRGIQNEVKRRTIFEQYRKRCDILCLQETHCEKSKEQLWAKEWGGRALFSSNDSSSRGVCILFHPKNYFNISNVMSDHGGRFIICQIETNCENTYTLSCVYAPNKDESTFFNALNQNLSEYTESKIVVGDFNTVLDVRKDRYNSQYNNFKAQAALNELMNDHLLMELWRVRNPDLQRFSWRRSDGEQASRIDFMLFSTGLDQKCDNIMYLQGILTDHSAIFCAITDLKHERGRGYWKFNTSLLQDTDVCKRIENEIDKCQKGLKEMSDSEKWEKIKEHLIKTLKTEARNKHDQTGLIIAQLSECLNYYEESFPLNRDEQKTYECTKTDLENLLSERTRGIIFRSRARWMMEAEKNTKYFMSLEKSRSLAKTCGTLLNEDGTLEEDPKKILEMQRSFYQELYTANPEVNFTLINKHKLLTQEQIDSLKVEITQEEIKDAISRMKTQKTPGPDGLPAEVYQVFKNKLSKPLLMAYQCAFSEGKMHPTSMKGILNLIPKKNKDTRVLKNLRPITLLNTDYKIIEKILAGRVQKVLPSIINNDQTGFMKTRRISVNIRRILDMMNYCAKNNIEAVIFNLDFMKAFDRAEVPSILKSLQYFNFPSFIVEWISILYNDFTVKVQNNGHFSEDIDINRSVHQGGCISAILFNILVETLANELRDNLIGHIQINNNAHCLNQYADDTGIFSMYNGSAIQKIVEELDRFERQSGLKVSYDKTEIYRIGSIRDTDAHAYTTRSIAWTNDSITVLGIEIAHDRIVLRNYLPLIKKTKTILNRWKSRNLSLGGKIQIINSLVSSMYVHKMLVLPNMSKKIISELNELLVNFIWNNKKAKIPLEVLQRSKEQGGMKLVNFEKLEMSLKCSWIQILNTDEKLADIVYACLAPVLRQEIFMCNLNKDDLSFVISTKADPFWRDVLRAWCIYNYDSTGENNSFLWWNSQIRVGGKPFFWADAYQRGLRTINQLTENGRFISCVKMYNRYGIDVMHYNTLVVAIPRRWKIEGRTEITTSYEHLMSSQVISRTVYKQINQCGNPFAALYSKWAKSGVILTTVQIETAFKTLYIISNSVKHRSFQFRLLHRAIVLNSHLFRWRLRSDNMCSFCDMDKETLEHFFYSCPVSQKIWEGLKTYMNNNMEGTSQSTINISCANVMLNTIVWNVYDVRNTICLIVKFYLYQKRCLGQFPNVNELIGYISKVKNIEKYYAVRSGHVQKHAQKWNLM